MEISHIKRINYECDLKPTCNRCKYNTDGVWVLDNECVCQDCLTGHEVEEIFKYYGLAN